MNQKFDLPMPPEWAAGGLDTAPPSLLYTVTPVVPGAGPPGWALGRLICEPEVTTLGLEVISIWVEGCLCTKTDC